jgi:anaerobic magnesium-protoporphyrin IX monomethyl ester cyclase
MRVLLVKPIIKNAHQSIPNLGLGYLSTALKKAGHHVNILDCVNKRITFNEFEKFIRSSDFDAIGFQVFFTDPLSAKKSLQIVKKHNPQTITIIGGICPSVMPQESFSYFTEADFGFRGEAEIGLPRLINKLSGLGLEEKDIPGLIWRNNGKTETNPAIFNEDLDSLGMPDWDLIDPRNYNFQTFNLTKSSKVAPIIVTRGCPYHCTFCSTHKVTGRHPRSHSVNYIIDQIKFLHSKFGIKEVSFFDDNLIANKATLEELCHQLIGQKFKIDWSSYGIRLDKLDRNILKLMEKAGCYIITAGIESGSQRILDHMQKGLIIENIREKAALIKSATNIKLMVSFILGYPLEDKADILKTIKFAKSLPVFSVGFYNFNPIPGTSIYKELVSSGELEEKFEWDLIESDRKPYAPKNIPLNKLLLLYRWAYISFYLRPKTLFNILKSANSWEKIKNIFNLLAGRLFKK